MNEERYTLIPQLEKIAFLLSQKIQNVAPARILASPGLLLTVCKDSQIVELPVLT